MTSKPTSSTHARGLHILGITYGLGSNNRDLIFNPEFLEPGETQSQITNWCEIEHIAYGPGLDAYRHFLDDPGLPFEIQVSERELFVQGDLSRRECEGRGAALVALGFLTPRTQGYFVAGVVGLIIFILVRTYFLLGAGIRAGEYEDLTLMQRCAILAWESDDVA